MSPDRELLLEIVIRMRESTEAAKNANAYADEMFWRGREAAFNEVYTELKGSGLGRREDRW
jgi:hypothetical protein